MSNVIQLDSYRLRLAATKRSDISGKHPSGENFGERLNRIRVSLEKARIMCNELKRQNREGDK